VTELWYTKFRKMSALQILNETTFERVYHLLNINVFSLLLIINIGGLFHKITVSFFYSNNVIKRWYLTLAEKRKTAYSICFPEYIDRYVTKQIHSVYQTNLLHFETVPQIILYLIIIQTFNWHHVPFLTFSKHNITWRLNTPTKELMFIVAEIARLFPIVQ
jgi:hypothetical protein